MTQEYKERQPSKSRADEETIDELPERTETDSDIDDILDEIDEVLEENAQEFIEGYIQRGGQ